jgi:hypothetical protein
LRKRQKAFARVRFQRRYDIDRAGHGMAVATLASRAAGFALSLMTAMLPRLSDVARQDHRRITEQLSRAVRVAAAALAPIAAAMLVLGPQIATLLFGHGRSTLAATALLGQVVAAFSGRWTATCESRERSWCGSGAVAWVLLAGAR